MRSTLTKIPGLWLLALLMVVTLLVAACAEDDDEVAADPPDDAEEEDEEPDEGPEPPDEDDEDDEDDADLAEEEEEAADEVRTYRVGYSSSPGIGDLGTLLAWDRLRLEGIDIETQFFAGADVVMQAIERGDLDFGTNIGGPAAMGAIQAGVPVEIVYGYVGDEWVLAGTTDIEGPEDLEGRVMAIHSHGGLSDVYVRYTLDQYDLDDVEVLVIPTSAARAEAIAQGEIDASPLQLDDAMVLEARDPEQFHVFTYFHEEADASTGVTVAGQHFIEENPDDLQRIVNALLETYRRLNDDPEWAVQESARFLAGHFEEDELREDIVRAYSEQGLWDPDGGLDPDAQRMGMEFNEQYEILEPGTVEDFESFYDFTFLENAFEEHGRYND